MNLPIPWKLGLIIGLFSIVIIGLLGLSYGGMEILSGSRAYVGGEGFYSKAHKAAVYRLTRYAIFHDDVDYQRYLEYIAIPLGDHQARLGLSQDPPNIGMAQEGFIHGRNHPDDVPILIFMARRLHAFRYMKEAIMLWGEADKYIAELQRVGTTIHQEVSGGHATPERMKALLGEVYTIDARLTPLEDMFSYTLGEGGRWIKRTLLLLMVVTTSVFFVFTLLIAFLISRHLCDEIRQLRSGASRIAGGDYSISLNLESKDEIGDLAKTFQQMALQRQRAEQLKDEFFANVSHELRTPLTLILSPLETLLQDQKGFEPGVRSALEIIHNNAVRLLQLVNGLLDFSKLDAGQIQARLTPVKITELTKMVYQDFQPLIMERQLQARLEMDPTEAVVMTDRYIYERILFNLLSNAVKFTAPGGTICVTLKCINDRFTLSVSDTGIGIPTEERDNIFQRFHQLEGSSTRRFEGTGLGLSLVKEFTTLLQGTVTVSSKVGEGSTFTIDCPAQGMDTDTVFVAWETPSGQLHAQRYSLMPVLPVAPSASQELLPKVLIAEDNAEMAAHMSSLLTALCQVHVAHDGHLAFAQVKEWHPDLVLTDVMMPGRDGLSLCRDIKADPETAAIPVVMVTALIHRDALLEGWKAGATDYLFKPFHPVELVTRVQSLLKTRLLQKQAEKEIMKLHTHLEQRALELQMANEELEAFSYSVSHDLRTPLRAIDGFSREVLENCQSLLSGQSLEDLQRIRRATQRMSQLIEDLLELSRLSRQDLQRSTVDLSAQAQIIIEGLRSSAPERTVNTVIPPGLSVEGDPRLLQIVLENLLRNAWKFTQGKPHAAIEFGSQKQEGQQVFFIKDNGAGFDMQYVGKLFKPFHRLHNADEFSGHGIGLALVQRIIQRHGGKIWVQAEKERGATFYFTLS